MMSRERWPQVEEIFQNALDLAHDQRARYIDLACAGDAELRREVVALLTHHESCGDLLDEPLYEQSGLYALATLIEGEGDPMVGQRIGAYQIEREIGRGGMGVVYLATRADHIFQRRVAIKIIKRGMDTDFVLRRFRHERQILAALDHQNITRLLDGGATPGGHPYFVMEYIEGLPFYTYCDARRLSVRERLALLCQVCDAVEYAHQKRIIHRDIKPSNILVSNAGVPKLFDFGIAKLLNPDLASETTPQTATAMRMMTVEYASPEQVQGLPVTLLSDVYSLGVVLYELLTGHRPYRFRNRVPHEMARVISEEAPEYPSVAVDRTDELLPFAHVDQEAITVRHLCEMRNETPEGLRRELSGSLDRIALKVLQKDPRERYQSTAALGEDIRSYLEGRPISAPLYVPSASKPVIAAPEAFQTTQDISIAVLPFKLIGAPQSNETGDEYLSIGLADALITRLSNVQRISVRPTSSVVRFCQEDCDPLAAGQALGVNHVLDGRIQRAGERVRVTVQLVSVHNHMPVWARQFDQRSTDVLSIQDSISEQVAEHLVPHLTGEERQQLAKRGTDNVKAFEAYMRGRYYWNSMTEDGFAKAIACFENAVDLDPAYAAAYAGIAEYYCWLAVYGLMPPTDSLAAARNASQRAIELDATLADVQTAHGLTLLAHQTQWEVAGARFRHAIELNPNYAPAHAHYACQLAMEGRFDESVGEAQRARKLDPLNPFPAYILTWNLYQARRYQEGLAQARALLESDPLYGSARFVMSWILRRTGAYDEAILEAQKAIELLGEIPMFSATLGAAYAEAGRHEAARRELAQLHERAAEQFVSPYHCALVHLALDEREEALAQLEQGVALSDPWIVWLAVEPQFDTLRNDARFVELLRQTNHPAARRDSHMPASGEKSIAVLPFKLLSKQASDDTGDAYLGIGLADALITRLSNVRSLHVRPTSAILRYREEAADALAAGRELAVDWVLEGRIKHASERIRLSLQLLDVRRGTSIWAHQFDEQHTDVLSLEDAISEHVAQALVLHLTGEERGQLKKRGTDHPEAFEAYLRGRYYWNTFTEEGFAKALLCYNRAVAYAPNYALAYTGIADYYNLLGVYAVLPFAETSAAAKEAALKAVALDDQLAEAYSALGFATIMHDFDWKMAEYYLSHAVELNPNYATGRSWYCYFLGMTGRFDEALEQVRRAIELDPLTPIIHHTLNWTYFNARQYDAALASARRLAANEPQYGLAYIFLCQVLWHTQQYDEAIEAGHRALALLGRSPYTLVWLAAAYAAAGQREQVFTLLDELQQLSTVRYVSPYLLAMVYCNLGDTERAFTELERALLIRDARLVWLGVDPQFDLLRRDPRCDALLRQTNNPTILSQRVSHQ